MLPSDFEEQIRAKASAYAKNHTVPVKEGEIEHAWNKSILENVTKHYLAGVDGFLSLNPVPREKVLYVFKGSHHPYFVNGSDVSQAEEHAWLMGIIYGEEKTMKLLYKCVGISLVVGAILGHIL